MATVKTIYSEVEIDVSLGEFDIEDLIEEVKAAGYKVIDTNEGVRLSNFEYNMLRDLILKTVGNDTLKYPWSRIIEKLELAHTT